MRVLLIKTSSLGDVIHTLPALTDAAKAIPDIRFDWVIEEAFADVPGWHPAVGRVIPVKLRYWRRHPLQAWHSGEWNSCKRRLGEAGYDAAIDAQGLLKSAWLLRYARGQRCGLDRDSAREPCAARFYDQPLSVAKNQHAVERVRQLLSAALGYAIADGLGDSGIAERFRKPGGRGVVFLHGTTWDNKHWPESYWHELAKLLTENGFQVQLPWGNQVEKQRAQRIAGVCNGEVLPKLSLTGVAEVIGAAAGCVGVDTGLGHLAAAVGTPAVALFGPTNPGLTGFYGNNQKSLEADYHCAPCLQGNCRFADESDIFPPCFSTVKPSAVIDAFSSMVSGTQA